MNYQQMLKCVKDAKQVVWRLAPATPGANWMAWTGGNAAPHGPVGDIFSEPGGQWGTGAHVNGPADLSGVTPDLNFTDLELLGNVVANAPEQLLVWGYVEIAADGQIRDNNGNTGETGRVFLGERDGCCNDLLELISDVTVSTIGTGDRGILVATPVEAGIYPMVIQISDFSAFSGFDLEFSADGLTWANVTTSTLTRPEWECMEIALCDAIPEGWSLLGPKPCCKMPSYGGDAAPVTDRTLEVVVGELENVDGPLNMNPDAATPIAWGGFQSQDNARVAVNGSTATVVDPATRAAHITASVTFINEDGPQGPTGNAQRAHPEVWVLRNGVRWALAQSYIRDADGQDSDTASVDKWDWNPVGAVYSLEVQQDSIETGANGQADSGTLEVFRDPEIANYLQVAAFINA